MKKTVLAAVGGLVALGVLCYAGSIWAQAQQAGSPAPAAAAPRTRIALLNLTFVIKNYQKYTHFQDEIKRAVAPFQGKMVELQKRAEELHAKSEAAIKAGQPMPREEYERQMTELKRKKEDIDAEAKLAIGKKNDDEMKVLYLDVVQAAQGYAQSRDFDLVLHYNDATTSEEYVSVQNIARKLNSGALMPLYAGAGMDISKEVVALLNYNLSNGGAQGGAAAAPSAPRTGSN
ncbi:MAG TPA: OmpH family outer membrane protein [Gemmataceae bacterium]|nr:OmpH family outer membrane protein [Gemmataceae bacterium]